MNAERQPLAEERSMPPSPTQRRRWPWVVGAALLLLIGGPIAWMSRLNSMERALVGKWMTREGYVTLDANRRFSIRYRETWSDPESTGSWRANETQIFWYHDSNEPLTWWNIGPRIRQFGLGGVPARWNGIRFLNRQRFMLEVSDPLAKAAVTKSEAGNKDVSTGEEQDLAEALMAAIKVAESREDWMRVSD